MTEIDYAIVGAGMAAFTAAQAIRDLDGDARIVLFGSEPEGPYQRPALSKGLWQGEREEEIIFGVEELGAELIPRRVARLEPGLRRLTDERGNEYGYRKLLLTTGVRPRRLPLAGLPGGSVHYLRTLADYRRLRAALPEPGAGLPVLVIGGGFLGAEISAALNQNGQRVTMAFPEAGISGLILPAGLAQRVNAEYTRNGIEVLAGHMVRGAEQTGETVTVALEETASGEVSEREFSLLLAAVGSTPAQELAGEAGIAVNDGIVVDELFRTDVPGVFAAGDVARYPDALFGPRRVEHEDHALHSGMHAGLAMAGEGEPYGHIPLFYSALYGSSYEAAGLLDSRMATRANWAQPSSSGTIYYLDDQELVRGVLLWNNPGGIDEARELLRRGELAPAAP